MGHIFKSALAAAAVSMMTMGAASTADAGCKGRACKQDRYGEDDRGYGYVTAHATKGGKIVTAPVRPGRWGDEVLVPGGAWATCEITCEYTLRRLTVDFWDGIGQNETVSPGYFRYDYDLETGKTHRRGPAVFGRY